MKLYPAARTKAFTRETICNAWKATGLLPYNPTAVLKTLPNAEPSASLQSITGVGPQTPRTPKTVEDLQSLRDQIAESTTEQIGRASCRERVCYAV